MKVLSYPVLFFCLLLFVSAGSVQASPDQQQGQHIQQRFNGILLNANLRIADGRDLKDGVIIMLHDILQTHQAPLIKNLQNHLTDAGYNSLAITLSLSMNDRKAPLTCEDGHYHKHTDALFEIRAWEKWLQRKGVPTIAYLGHHYGANQLAWYARYHADKAASAVILIAPLTWYVRDVAGRFEITFNKSLHTYYGQAQQAFAQKRRNIRSPFLFCEDSVIAPETFLSYYDNDKRKDTPFLIPDIKSPLLVIMAGKDVQEPDLPALMQTVRARDLSLEFIDGADHDFSGNNWKDVGEIIASYMVGKFEKETIFKDFLQ